MPRRTALFALSGGEKLDHGLANLVELGSQLLQDLSGDTLTLTNQTEKDVLGADVVVTELEGLAQGELEYLLGPGGEGNVARGRLRSLANDLDDLGANGFEVDAEALEAAGGHTVTLVDQAKQDVLGADVVVVEQPGFFLS